MPGRKRGPLAELRRGLRKSTPNRMLARFLSGGRHQSFKSIAKGYGKPVSTHRMADEQKLTDAQRRVAPSARGRRGAAKKTAARKKTAVKKPDAYAAARQIPARNQAAAKKTAAAAKRTGKKTAAGTVQVPRRNPDGTFDGTVSFPTFGPREQAAYERALRGQVDPVQQVRQPRRPR
jgi:hypothetical protein